MKCVYYFCIFGILAWIAASKNVNVRPHLDGRIVGGKNTTIENHPHQVSLQSYLGSHFCGGSVISESVILTAAHCVDGSWPSEVEIRAGTTTKNNGGVVVAVKKIHVHEKYNPANIDYDVAVLELAKSLPLSKQIQPVALPDESEYLNGGEVAVATGWGALKQGGSSPQTLQEVKLPVVEQKECNVAYDDNITDRMVCAGRPSGGIDSCQGDSGGPLVSNKKVHGIVSWGYGCAQEGYPGVYTRVTAVRKWIKSKVNL